MIKRLFIDIETSPNICYTWRIGQKIFIDHNFILKERAIICICYKWEHEKKVHSLEWDGGDDSKMVKVIHKIMSEADEVVGHNSDRFDTPWINTRIIKAGLYPMSTFKEVDTLKMAKRKFYFNNNKLDYLAQFLFNDKKFDTGGFGLWKDIFAEKRGALNKMVKYCKKDVILLQRVYDKLIKFSTIATHAGVAEGRDRWTCPKCASEKVKKNKTWITAMGMRRHEMNCNSCGRYYRVSDKVYSDYMSRFDILENEK